MRGASLTALGIGVMWLGLDATDDIYRACAMIGQDIVFLRLVVAACAVTLPLSVGLLLSRA